MALEISAPVISEIVKNFVIEAIRQARYPFRLSKYVEDLGKEKENLLLHRESVQRRAMIAEQKAQGIDILVMNWLDKTNALIADAESLEEMAKMNKSCCLEHCPNWIWQCRLAKQIEKKAKEMVDQQNKCKFESFAHPAPPLGLTNYPSENFLLFNTTKLASDELLQALKDDEVSMIGLHGMGGCGKTTLAKQVGKAAMQLFDRVVFVVVSNSINIQKIQDSIADPLGLKLEGKSELERAQSLRSRLTSGENIFIILDDVWDMLKFEDIGIPSDSNFKRCKVLLTTRRERVCTLMDCQKIIHLHLLREEEAWILFQHYARIDINLTLDNVKDLAQKIVHECKGLAIAIAAVASTLKGAKNLYEWEETLATLRDPKWMIIEEDLRDPYKCLKLSYDHLKDQEAKSIFLLCSVFPEDFKIHEEDLVRYGMGLGLLRNLDSFGRARNRLNLAKDKLIGSCLLIKSDDGQWLKMHDLVRDLALWIAKEGKSIIVGPEKSQEVLKEDGSKKENTITYLWLDKLYSFPYQVYFPNLVFLCVCLDSTTTMEKSFLTDECLKGMLELRVLVLKFEYWKEQSPFFATSFQSLTNLCCLHLEGWKLGNISFIGSLERLQSLALRNCSFDKLPNEIINLESLRLLDVHKCEIEENPYKVIERCSKLEELYFIGNSGSQWKDQQEHAVDIFGIKGDFPELQRYCIEIGTSSGLRGDFWTSVRGTSIEHFDVSTMNATIKDLVQRAEILCLIGIHGGCKNVIPEMIQRTEGMKELTKLVLDNSEDFEFFVDTTNRGSIQFQDVFSRLIELQIKNMKGLKTFYSGTSPKPHQMLNMCNLKVLRLYKCPFLTHVFTFAFAESLVMLEKLEVNGCDRLKHILADEMQHNEQRSNLVLQRLKQLFISNCAQLEYLTTTLYARGLEKLEYLYIENASMLEYVFAQSNQEGQNHNEFRIIELPSLEHLILCKLPYLISIFPKNYYSRYSSLKRLALVWCSSLNIKSWNDLIVGRATLEELGPLAQMSNEAPLVQLLRRGKSIELGDFGHIECVFQLTGLPLNTELNPLVSSLESLYLSRLPMLRYISKGPTRFISLQNLQIIWITKCNELKYIFSLSIAKSLSQLRELKIEKCDKLEQIIEGEESFDGLKMTSNSSAPLLYGSQNTGSFNLCSLRWLTVRDCPMLKSLFTLSTAKTLTSLNELNIQRCGGLQYVVKDERVEGNKSEEIVDDDRQALLPSLNDLTLGSLPNLISICPENYYSTCSSLKTLSLLKCPRLNKKSFGDLIVGRTTLEELGPLAQMSNEAPLVQLLRRGKSIELGDFGHIECVFQLTGLPLNTELNPLVSSLESLYLSRLPMLRYISKGPTRFISLQNLQEVYITECNELKCIFSLSIVKSLSQLRELEIEKCDKLEQIIEGEESFDSLKMTSNSSAPLLYGSQDTGSFNLCSLLQLKVIDCPMLKSLFTLSTAKTLTSLNVLEIERCDGLQYVIKEERVEGNKSEEIVHDDQQALLPSLNCLSLRSLPNIISIYPENYYSTCSSLKTLSLLECPRLNMKSISDLIVGRTTLEELGPLAQMSNEAPLVQLLRRSESIELGDCGHIECVFQLTGLPHNTEPNPLVSSLGYLRLSRLPMLRYISKGPTQFISLQNLRNVRITKCNELKCIFSLSIAKNLSQMRGLKIEKCDKLEQIIEGEESFDGLKMTSNSSAPLLYGSQNTGSFNLCSLRYLIVRDCPMLKSLFTLSTAKTLTSLRALEIERCDGLQYVIKDERVEGNKSEEIVDDDRQALFPCFVFLNLIDLPNLTEICRGFKLQSWLLHEVENCPKLIPVLAASSEELPQTSDEEEEHKKDTEDEAVEENKLVPYDLNKAGKKIILELENQRERDFSCQRTSNFNREAGYSGEAAPELSNTAGVAIPGLPLRPSISRSSDHALPLGADQSSSSSTGEHVLL